MNIAIILAGGSGSRMKTSNTPKQYLEVLHRPIICYCLETFQNHYLVDGIIIVAEDEWHSILLEWLKKENISKFISFAAPGKSRQHSVYSGLKEMKKIAKGDDVVIVHDAARPLVDSRIIRECVEGIIHADGIMPVISVKDTVYQSNDGKKIASLLIRDELFAGQAPESFRFDKYFAIHERMTDQEIGNVRGSSEVAYMNGLDIHLIQGSEMNFKITTREDLMKFEMILNK